MMKASNAPPTPEDGKKNKHEKPYRIRVRELDVSTIGSAMVDHVSHPHSTCAHYDEDEPETLRLQTNLWTMIPPKQRTLHVTDTHPCESEYEEYPLAA